jgi:hypothetical protein
LRSLAGISIALEKELRADAGTDGFFRIAFSRLWQVVVIGQSPDNYKIVMIGKPKFLHNFSTPEKRKDKCESDKKTDNSNSWRRPRVQCGRAT